MSVTVWLCEIRFDNSRPFWGKRNRGQELSTFFTRFPVVRLAGAILEGLVILLKLWELRGLKKDPNLLG